MTPPHATESELRTAVTALAKAWIGTPYVWGAKQPPIASDCSGFVNRLWEAVGVTPKDTALMWNANTMWHLRDKTSTPQPGDAACYGMQDKCHHVVILIEDNKVIGAGGGDQTCTTIDIAKARGAVAKIHDSPNYRKDLLGFIKMPFNGE